jgi:hypothetical protein
VKRVRDDKDASTATTLKELLGIAEESKTFQKTKMAAGSKVLPLTWDNDLSDEDEVPVHKSHAVAVLSFSFLNSLFVLFLRRRHSWISAERRKCRRQTQSLRMTSPNGRVQLRKGVTEAAAAAAVAAVAAVAAAAVAAVAGSVRLLLAKEKDANMVRAVIARILNTRSNASTPVTLIGQTATKTAWISSAVLVCSLREGGSLYIM